MAESQANDSQVENHPSPSSISSETTSLLKPDKGVLRKSYYVSSLYLTLQYNVKSITC